jgi:hypothetical protein
MAITSVPTVLSQNTDAFINAGMTSRIQSFTGAAASGSLTINPTSGGFIRLISQTSSSTINFAGAPAGYANTWYVEVNGRGSNTVTFTGVTWDGGSAPSISSAGKTVLIFYTPDGGTTIYGKSLFASL